MNNRLAYVAFACFVVVATVHGIMAYHYRQAQKNYESVAEAAIDAEVAEAAKRGTLRELPPGKKLEGFALTGPNGTIVYLVRPMRPSETPEVHELNAYKPDSPVWVIREHADEQR